MKRLRSAAFLLLALVLAASACLTLRSWHSQADQDRDHTLAASSRLHPLGTDALGRDRLSRLGTACLLSFALSSAAAAASTGMAALVGLLAGSASRRQRRLILSLCDLLTALPWLFIIMIVRGLMPLDLAPILSTLSTYLLLACFGWSTCARVVSGAVASLRRSAWIAQLRAQGVRERRLLLRHLLPHLRPLLLTQFLITVPAFLIAEVNLGLLGFGTAEPLPSWGGMLRDLQSFGAWTGPRSQLMPLLVLMLVTGSLQLCLVQEGSA